MNRQRGIISAYIYLASAIAILGLLSGMAYMAKSHIDGVDRKAHERGISEEKARWQARESAELAQANNTISFLNAAYRDREYKFSLELNLISVNYQKEKQRAQADRDRDIAAVRDGFRLRDPGARAAAPCESGSGSAAAPPGAAAGGSDATRGGELSGEATGFLLGEAARADEVVDKLHRMQDLVTRYWTACSAPKAGAAP